MKIFAVIFALYIFSLSANAFDEIECLCEKYEVVADMDGNSQSGDDGCCAEGCSPFSVCHTCSGFTISPIFYIARPVFNKKTSASITHTQQFISTFYGNIWQPPKIG